MQTVNFSTPIGLKFDGWHWNFVLCDLEIRRMTFKNNRAPILWHIKLCASFHRHTYIQTGVMVRKRLNWVMTSVALTFDLWPWPFALTSLLSMVLTPENFMMVWWWKHSEKGVTDGPTDRRTDWLTELFIDAWSQLKTLWINSITLIFTQSLDRWLNEVLQDCGLESAN